jgi:hypothetical protein
MAFSSLCCTWTVCLQNPVQLLEVSIYNGFFASPGVSVYKSLCCNDACPSTKAFELHLDVSLFKRVCCTCACLSIIALCFTCTCLPYKSFVLHLDVSVFKKMCCTCTCLSSRAMCCTCTCLPTRGLCCTWTRALCCTWTFLSIRACTAPVGVCLQELCAAPGGVVTVGVCTVYIF